MKSLVMESDSPFLGLSVLETTQERNVKYNKLQRLDHRMS
jgi:hypothetical protein